MTKIAGLETISVSDDAEDYGRWLIHGPQGSGKTTLAATIAAFGPTLFIDLVGERGTRSIKGSPNEKNISIIRPGSITELDDIYWALAKGDHPYKAVIIDSVTSFQKMAMRYLMGHDETAVKEIKQGASPADIRTWGQALDIMQDLAVFWYGLADAQRSNPMHVIMVAQTKLGESDEGEIIRHPDVQRGALSSFLAAPDYIVYTDVEDNPDAIGDESQPPVKHIVRFGANPEYRTKARLPRHLYGKIPAILGRSKSQSLADLSRILGIGGSSVKKETK